MHRPMTPTAIRGSGVLLGVAALCWMIAPAPARADTVTDWNGYASTAIVATAGQPPPAAVLSFAMVQGAVYDAVNAIDRGHRAYLVQPPAAPLGLQGRGGGDGGVPRPRRALPGAAGERSSRSTTRRWPRSRTPRPARRRAGSPPARRQRRRCSPRAADDGRFGPFTPVIGTTPGV